MILSRSGLALNNLWNKQAELIEADIALRQRERQAQANPDDTSALERARISQARAGAYGEAAKTLGQLTDIRGKRTSKQRTKIKFRGLKQRLGGARKTAKAMKRFPGDSRRQAQLRPLRTRARPYIDAFTSARNSGKHHIADKLARQLRRLADKHEIYPHDLLPGDPHDPPDHHDDAEMMADLHGAVSGEHDETDHDDRHERWRSKGYAGFKTRKKANDYSDALRVRHYDHGVEVSHKYNKYNKHHEIHYGIGDRGAEEEF